MDNTNCKFKISLSLNILNHLGINLYSNIPAVLSEVVANAWDADATEVDINFDISNELVVVTDNGHGMSVEDFNNKYLYVGYQRRENGEALSVTLKRPVMGRKGIGKLSLFSVADTIEVHSVKDGQKAGLIMNLPIIQDTIKGKDKREVGVYHPEVVDEDIIDISKGTRIILRDFRKSLSWTVPYLKTRLARRFAVIGSEHNFRVKINKKELTIKDRNYFSKLQYIWTIGKEQPYANWASNAEAKQHFTEQLQIDGQIQEVHGWIGTFLKAGDAQDEGNESLNKISILVRGKLAQEDILDEFGDAGVYAQYLIGEIHADFLDLDNEKDIATSSRQRLIEDDPRYRELSDFIKKLIGKIRDSWTGLRNRKGEEEARKNPVIDEWFGKLNPDTKKQAKSLFGKINRMPVNDDEKARLFTHSVIAFEGLQYKNQLNVLENVSVDNIGALAEIFGNFDEIEASLYHQITRERIAIIKTLQDKVTDENALEKVIQEHLFKYLWLLDPMWERATETPIMEQAVSKEFGKINAKLTKDEKKGRLDIKYKSTSGSHIIIELKRASVSVSVLPLIEQVNKYRTALEKCLKSAQKEKEPIEIVCVLGKYPTDWEDSKMQAMLKSIDARIVLYNNMVDQAYKVYKQYLDEHKKAGRLTEFLERLNESINPHQD